MPPTLTKRPVPLPRTAAPLHALVIDDEPLAHQVIDAYAGELDFLQVAAHCHRATEAYPILRQRAIDLIFLDINMPDLQGLDFLRSLRAPPRVIVTTAYEEYALEGFELQVSDYLLKPFRFSRFRRAVEKVRSEITATTADAPVDHLFLKVDRKFHRVDFADIHYLEGYGNFVKVWTGTDCLLTARTLSSLTAELPAARFLRIHKSYVINKAQLQSFAGAKVSLHGGQVLPVGKLYRGELTSWIKG